MSHLRIKQAEERPKYYVVRMDGNGKAPTVAHRQRNMAFKAAHALAMKNPGVEFIVVKQKTALRLENAPAAQMPPVE